MELDPDAFEAADLAEYGLPKLKELKEGILEALGEQGVNRAHGCVWLAGKRLGDKDATLYTNAPLFERILGPGDNSRHDVQLHILVAVIYALENEYSQEELLQAIRSGVLSKASHRCRSVGVQACPVLTAGLAGIMSGRMPLVQEHSACFADGHVVLEIEADHEDREMCQGVDPHRCQRQHNSPCIAVPWDMGIGAGH